MIPGLAALLFANLVVLLGTHAIAARVRSGHLYLDALVFASTPCHRSPGIFLP